MDAGVVTDNEAPLHVGSFLSAGVDTTTNAIANGLFCFAQHPDQWSQIVSDPTLIRSALLEILRFESPFQTFFRTTLNDVEIAGVPLGKNQKVLISIGSANRDPRRWDHPDTFEVTRKAAGHLAFGVGIHGCVGQTIARLEMETLLAEMVRRVKSIEICGTPKRVLHNTLRGFESLPIALRG